MAMNESHSDVTDWGLAHVAIARDATILDVGCGGGRTVQKLSAAASEGRVSGVDYSAESVATSQATNRAGIAAGRIEIRQASVSKLPFPDAAFDLVTAVETHYYWPDLANDLREVLRVVKPGGAALVIAECYPGGHNFRAQQIAMLPLRANHLGADQLRDWFAGAGFADVQVAEKKEEGWVCVTGRKPRA
jgi:SAM-dependent methyltransferase